MRRLLSTILCALFAFMLIGCTKQEPAEPAEQDTLLLGFAQLGSESGWRMGNTESVKQAAERAGVQLMFTNAQQSQEKQIKAIRSFIAYQVDVIAFPPIVEEGWDHVLAEAKAAGIPVLLVDRHIKTSDPSLFAGLIGSDFLEEGYKAARFLLEKTDGWDEVRIVEMTGTVDSTPMVERSRGFAELLEGKEKYTIVGTISGDFLRSKGKECMRQLLKEHPDANVLYSHNDSMTFGAIEVMEEAGYIPGKDIVIITVDGEQEAIDLLIQGKINCVVECTPLLGDMVMETAMKLKRGEPIPKILYSVERVFSEFDEDLGSLLPRGY